MGCSPWGRDESDTTERLHFTSLTMYLPSYPHLTHEGSEKPCDLPIVLQVVSGGVGI